MRQLFSENVLCVRRTLKNWAMKYKFNLPIIKPMFK